MIREPLPRLSAAFSAMSRQHTMSKNDVASSHSWVWRFCHRRLHGQTESGRRLPRRGETQLGVPRDVPDKNYCISTRHWISRLSLAQFFSDGSAAPGLAADLRRRLVGLRSLDPARAAASSCA